MANGRKLAIVGFANSREYTPFSDPAMDHWFCNEMWNWVEDPAHPERRWTLWWELHARDVIGETVRTDTPQLNAHLEWLAKQTQPIMMQRHFEDMPASVAFPLDALERKFARKIPFFKRYWTSTIGFQLGYAIAQGRDDDFQPDGSGTHYDWIGLYGIDLAGDSEYVYQRPNAEMFAGFAAGVGIELYCHPESAMFKGECVYGFEVPPADAPPLTRAHFDQQLKMLQGELAKHQEQVTRETAIINTLQGAIQQQQQNLALVTNYVKRGIGLSNLVQTVQIQVDKV